MTNEVEKTRRPEQKLGLYLLVLVIALIAIGFWIVVLNKPAV